MKFERLTNLRKCVFQQTSISFARLVFVGLLAFAFVACRGGGVAPSVKQSPHPKTILLSLHTETSPIEDRISVEISAHSEHSIFQLSTRVQFNPLALKPIAIWQGELVDEQAVFFALDDQDGFVPLAFTYHQGDKLPDAQGVIAHIRFEVLDADHPSGIHFYNDEEYLIARDAGGNDLPLQLAVIE